MKTCPFCGSKARIYGNTSFAHDIYAQVRCKNKECGARGPMVKTPVPYVRWAVEHRAKDWEERARLQQEAETKAHAEVRTAAARAWDSRVGDP